MSTNYSALETRLWEAADSLRANSNLKASEYSVPVLGMIFLRYADAKFETASQKIKTAGSGRRTVGKTDYQAQGALYLPTEARYKYLQELSGDADLGKALNEAMIAIERENEDLKGTLPRNYRMIDNQTLASLLKTFGAIEFDGQGDVFGRIYEYFLGEFAMSEGQKGGEFFTPTSIVQLIVEILQPFAGLILDPACGSGGMFVQSAHFMREHRKSATTEISIYGEEKTGETVRLCKMNLAVHGLSGDIRQGNSYYEDLHNVTASGGKFDFVMANPPFNVDKVDKEKLKGDGRFPFGVPRADNANYLWMQMFYAALNPNGRAGYVMASSAGDAGGSELEIRKKMIQAHAVDIMVAVGPNFFYTVTLPCTLWFLDKGKQVTTRAEQVLFIDARAVFRQIDRAHREWTPAQVEFLANITRLYRGDELEFGDGSRDELHKYFADGENFIYRDVPGLCCAASQAHIEEQGWSLNPGRYVGVTPKSPDEFVFLERLEELSEELELLNAQSHDLETTIAANTAQLLSKI